MVISDTEVLLAQMEHSEADQKSVDVPLAVALAGREIFVTPCLLRPKAPFPQIVILLALCLL